MPSAYVLTAPRQLELRAYDEPPLGPREVRLASILSGISHGTEMNLYRGTSPFAEKHFDAGHRLFVPNEETGFREVRLGYELVSRVVEVGREVSSVRVGDLVHTATYHQPTTVVNLEAEAGSQIPMQVLPPNVTPEQAVFSALIGVALGAVQDAQIKVGDHVAVFGLGTIGLITLQLARLSGALYVTGIDPLAKRREMATEIGADEVIDPNAQDPAVALKFRDSDPSDPEATPHAGSLGGTGAPGHPREGPLGPDVVIEASGHYPALQSALRSVHMAGTVVTLGYYQGGATEVRLGEEWHHNRLNLVSSMAVWRCPSRYHPMWDRPRITRTSFALLERGLVQVECLITQRFAYQDAPRAYRLVDQHPEETIKVVLTYE